MVEESQFGGYHHQIGGVSSYISLSCSDSNSHGFDGEGFEVDYAKTGHNRYALLSYVLLGDVRGLDGEGFDLNENDDEESEMSSSDSSLRELMQHVSSNPMEHSFG
ncbi:hypothetical protein ISN44_As13g017560 [Arabidopsis suecica]|uniref:Uncharacterized protein n=1 Tax=Arabidopsis suecica TaxID=45249 RepID=A0A8T1XTE5_ARASU|nr:hypothetical protein ISN44_As13g017560 [Arabidopsis suecica]